MPRQPTDTKFRILNTARTLYSVHGCDATTLDDIISAIGITKGAFYHYFKSKDALCLEVIQQVIDEYQQLTESIDADAEPIDQLRWIVRELAGLNASGKWVNCRLIVRMSADSHDSYPCIQQKLHSFWQWYTDFYAGLIQRCRDKGQLSTEPDAKTQTTLLMSFMAGAVTLETITPGKSSFEELADAVIEMLRR